MPTPRQEFFSCSLELSRDDIASLGYTGANKLSDDTMTPRSTTS